MKKIDTDNTVFYIPRKILEYDFYKKSITLRMLKFFKSLQFSYMKTKNSLFFLQVLDIRLLQLSKLIENMGGINNEVNNPNVISICILNYQI